MFFGDTVWSGPLLRVPAGAWAPFPFSDCTFFDPAGGSPSDCYAFRWVDTTPLDMCCICGGGTISQPPFPASHSPVPPPSSPVPPFPPCLDHLPPEGGWLIDVDKSAWSSYGWADCNWIISHQEEHSCSAYAFIHGPASEMCCACGGGVTTAAQPSPALPQPAQSVFSPPLPMQNEPGLSLATSISPRAPPRSPHWALPPPSLPSTSSQPSTRPSWAPLPPLAPWPSQPLPKPPPTLLRPSTPAPSAPPILAYLPPCMAPLPLLPHPNISPVPAASPPLPDGASPTYPSLKSDGSSTRLGASADTEKKHLGAMVLAACAAGIACFVLMVVGLASGCGRRVHQRVANMVAKRQPRRVIHFMGFRWATGASLNGGVQGGLEPGLPGSASTAERGTQISWSAETSCSTHFHSLSSTTSTGLEDMTPPLSPRYSHDRTPPTSPSALLGDEVPNDALTTSPQGHVRSTSYIPQFSYLLSAERAAYDSSEWDPDADVVPSP